MMKILIVEDDPLNLTLFKELITHSGYEAITAQTGLEGIAAAEQTLPMLILMDWYLRGGMDGLTAAKQIKSTSQIAHIPIIIVSAHYEPGIEAHVQAIPCEGFARKPVDLHRLRELIETFVRVA